MIIEYPSYYEKFRCIGGQCKDTCCAGWEVDVDEESSAYYRSLKGPFAEKLRAHLCEEEGACSFPLTKEGNCPFLQKDHLCEMFIALGEESLCQTCTEYPRYFMDIGDYEQIDMSLSCMELARIFFTESERIEYIRSENELPGEDITEEERETLIEVLALRNQCIQLLQSEDTPFPERMQHVRALVSTAQGLDPAVADRERGYLQEDFPALVERMKHLDSLRSEWDTLVKRYEQACEDPHFMDALPQWIKAEGTKLDAWFTKLAVYFIYRYFIDTCLDGDIEIELCLVHRSLMILLFMLYERWTRQGALAVEDVIDLSHLFSKEVEHDEGNVRLLKALDS